MSGNKYKKILVSSLLLVLALWIATPKVFIHDLMHHDHSGVELTKEAKIKSQPSEDCDFEKYDKPVYFSLFKFICSFIPSRSKTSGKITERAIQLSGISYAISLFRGPPVN